ncbi:hypothetical protein [Paraburkholderia terrae]
MHPNCTTTVSGGAVPVFLESAKFGILLLATLSAPLSSAFSAPALKCPSPPSVLFDQRPAALEHTAQQKVNNAIVTAFICLEVILVSLRIVMDT